MLAPFDHDGEELMGNMSGCPHCFIVPPEVLRRSARDEQLDENVRTALRDTYARTLAMRVTREGARQASLLLQGAMTALRAQPGTTIERVFDCRHGASLPGQPVTDPAHATDEAPRTVYATTAKVAEFYRSVLGRESVDGHGMDLVSSVHYRVDFDNAFWNGQQMVYGDGDGQMFTSFYASPDVIGHELTHGVTQFESGLRYEGESGALNESISDVFGAVFHQWFRGWPASRPEGWLIGALILGPSAKAKGKSCLRDMLQPSAGHCLSPQPGSYKKFDPTADVHTNSGIPNKAFALFAQAVGGNAWERAIKVWYQACTGRRLASNATFVDFARLTIDAAGTMGVGAQAQAAWRQVDVPFAIA
jgi:Zn-dependent metalloprotease